MPPSNISMITINEDILDDFSDNISYKASTALFNWSYKYGRVINRINLTLGSFELISYN